MFKMCTMNWFLYVAEILLSQTRLLAFAILPRTRRWMPTQVLFEVHTPSIRLCVYILTEKGCTVPDSCLSITAWQQTSKTQDNQSIISLRCTPMIPLPDTKDISRYRQSGGLKIRSAFLQKGLVSKNKIKNPQSRRPPLCFVKLSFSGYHRSHCSQQCNLFHLKTLCSAIYIQR